MIYLDGKMRFLIIITLFFFSDSIAQSVSEQSMAIEIINDSLQVFANHGEITISLKCKNFTDKNLLLYGFESELRRYTDVVSICNVERTGGGIALFVYNERGEIQRPEWSIPDSIDYKPMPKERLEVILNNDRLRFINGKKIIKGSGVLYFDRKIDLKDFHLKRGRYYLQIGYYAGKGVKKVMVGEEQIEKDKKAHAAELYQGCAISNKITFRVD
jgi:hypothetical protein